jgi:hypothetical protein
MNNEKRKEYMQQYNKNKKDLINSLKQKVRMQEIKIKELESENKILKEVLKVKYIV